MAMAEAASLLQGLPQLLTVLGDWIGAIPSWIEAAVARDPRLGYLALGLAMFLENLIPPIPSELIQPLGGMLVQQGQLALEPVILGFCPTIAATPHHLRRYLCDNPG
jgi:membrane protein DedA with SNARE-associated domain